MGVDRVPAPTFHGRVEAGKIRLDERNKFADLIQRLDGNEISISLKKFRRGRSSNQNRYLHGVVIPMIAEAMGEDDIDSVKDALKWEFLRTDHEDGKLPHISSTASLDTAQMTEFIEQCRRLAAQMYGINIPDPGDY